MVLVCSLASAGVADTASLLYKEAIRLEKAGKDLEAFTMLVRAAGLRPGQSRYREAVDRLRVRASQSLAALNRLQQAAALDPDNRYLAARLEARLADEAAEADGPPPTLAEIQEALAREPVVLDPARTVQSFDLKGDARALYEQVCRAYGITAVFDADFNAGSAVRFRVDDATFREAIRALVTLTATFLVPLNDRTVLVANDTQAKRTELEPMMATLIPLPQVMSIEEANEVGRAIQQLLDIKRLAVDANRRAVFVRDTVTKVRLAEALYADLARRRGEVMIDIEMVSASRTSLTNLGLALPTSFPVLNLSTIGNAQPPDPGDAPLVGVGGGETLFGIQVADASFAADWTRSHASVLTRFRIRATDGLPASMHIGDKYPIVNAIFSPIVITDDIQDSINDGTFRAPFPSFTFEDLGLVLKVTPRVHDRREVSLSLEAEFRLLTGASLNGLPVISTRKFVSAARLREGQTSLVSGLAVVQITRSRSGLAGPGHLPFIGTLLARNSWQHDVNELILTITPHLTVLPPAEQFAQRTFLTGSESRFLPLL